MPARSCSCSDRANTPHPAQTWGLQSYFAPNMVVFNSSLPELLDLILFGTTILVVNNKLDFFWPIHSRSETYSGNSFEVQMRAMKHITCFFQKRLKTQTEAVCAWRGCPVAKPFGQVALGSFRLGWGTSKANLGHHLKGSPQNGGFPFAVPLHSAQKGYTKKTDPNGFGVVNRCPALFPQVLNITADLRRVSCGCDVRLNMGQSKPPKPVASLFFGHRSPLKSKQQKGFPPKRHQYFWTFIGSRSRPPLQNKDQVLFHP